MDRVDSAEGPVPVGGFRLDIPGVASARFLECTGLDDPAPADAAAARRRGRRVVTLRSGVFGTREILDWFAVSATGAPERRDVTIVALTADGTGEVTRWDLFETWPSQWQGAPIDAASDEVAVDSVTLVPDSIERG